jgi:hypothetical protein
VLGSDGGVEGAVAIANGPPVEDNTAAEDNATSEDAEANAEAKDVACALTELCEDITLLTASEPASGPSAGGSNGVSISGAPSSEWRPTGLRGNRRVPLFGFGSSPRESQTML